MPYPGTLWGAVMGTVRRTRRDRFSQRKRANLAAGEPVCLPANTGPRTSVRRTVGDRAASAAPALRGLPSLAGWCLCYLVFFCVPIGQANAQPSYTLEVVPQFPRLIIHRDWTPLVEYLSRETGAAIQLKLHDSIPGFEVELLRGGPDFAFMNPYQAMKAKKQQGYVPLVRDSAHALKTILVVKKDSPIKTLQDLNGKLIAFPSPNAFAASLYARALLTDKNIEFIPRYVLTHPNVYRHIILGKATAGGGVEGTLARESSAIRAQLRTLHTGPGVAPHPLCAHPRVPAVLREAVTRAILDLPRDKPNGQRLLEAVQLPKPVRAHYARDYEPLERLDLDKYLPRPGGGR